MIHKCKYCDSTIAPCSKPCFELTEKKKGNSKYFDHECCTCTNDASEDVDNTCELPYEHVCSKELCIFKHMAYWYKDQFIKAHNDDTKKAELLNQYRIINMNPMEFKKALETGKLNVDNIKIYWSRKALTWGEDIPTEIGYELMLMGEAMAREWSAWLGKKNVNRLEIDEQVASKSRKKITESEELRNKPKVHKPLPKQPKEKLEKWEKLILDRCITFGWTQEQSMESFTSMGVKFGVEIRDLKSLGYDWKVK